MIQAIPKHSYSQELIKQIFSSETEESLDLSTHQEGKIDDESGMLIGQALATCTSLTALNVSKHGLGEKTEECIGRALLKNETLTSLTMNFNRGFASDGLPFIGEALKTNTTLRALHFKSCRPLVFPADQPLRNNFVLFATALSINPSIIELSMSGNSIGTFTSDDVKKQTGRETQGAFTELQMIHLEEIGYQSPLELEIQTYVARNNWNLQLRMQTFFSLLFNTLYPDASTE